MNLKTLWSQPGTSGGQLLMHEKSWPKTGYLNNKHKKLKSTGTLQNYHINSFFHINNLKCENINLNDNI